MTRSSVLSFVGKQAVALAALAGALVVAPVVWAAPPVPFAMTTEISFPDGSGFFAVQQPGWICPTGTFENLRSIDHPLTPGAFTVTAVVKYTCDNGSGTFYILVHPQANPGNAGDGFDVSGPWSILSGGTGDYKYLRGYGGMGFVITDYDEVNDVVYGVESFAGVVQINK